MWHAIKSQQLNYFFKCSLEGDTITFYLYDLHKVWSEKCNTNDILQRAKNMNRRISYDREIVITTLQSAIQTNFSVEPQDSDKNKVLLKYHIIERPFNFEWNLQVIQKDEFQRLITNPLFLSIQFLSEQITELKNTIRKKDLEIKQYITEGAVLQRKTVATEEFKEEDFNARFSIANEISKSFLKISETIRSSVPLSEVKVAKENKEKPNRSSTFVSKEKTKKSPNKKRKFFENRNLLKLNLAKSKRKQSLEFESSQSQSLSQTPSPPQEEELAGIFQSLSELNAKRLASSGELDKDDSF